MTKKPLPTTEQENVKFILLPSHAHPVAPMKMSYSISLHRLSKGQLFLALVNSRIRCDCACTHDLHSQQVSKLQWQGSKAEVTKNVWRLQDFNQQGCHVLTPSRGSSMVISLSEILSLHAFYWAPFHLNLKVWGQGVVRPKEHGIALRGPCYSSFQDNVTETFRF